MTMIPLVRPWTEQPPAGWDFASRWGGKIGTSIIGDRTSDGSVLTTVGTTGTTETAFGRASTHSGAGTNLRRALIRNYSIGTIDKAATLLAVFRTTTTALDKFIAAFGSDNGATGNTLFGFATGTSLASTLRVFVGNNSINTTQEYVGVGLNSGRVHVAAVALDAFDNSTSTARVALNGVLQTSFSVSATGTLNTYNWVVAGGTRRTTDLAGPACEVVAVVPFRVALSNDELVALTAQPWEALFEPRRIYVPFSAAAGGTPTLTDPGWLISGNQITPRGNYAF